MLLHTNRSHGRQRWRALTTAAALAASTAMLTTSPAHAQPSLTPTYDSAREFTAGRYIVQLAEQPVAAYDGHLSGFEKTTPRIGAKVQLDSAAARKYAQHIASKGAQVRAAVGNPRALYEFSTVFSGFAADLTADQARELTCTVKGYSASQGSVSPYTVNWWFVDQQSATGNVSAPAETIGGTQGQPLTIPVTWKGLDPTLRYWGWLDLTADGITNRTTISIG